MNIQLNESGCCAKLLAGCYESEWRFRRYLNRHVASSASAMKVPATIQGCFYMQAYAGYHLMGRAPSLCVL